MFGKRAFCIGIGLLPAVCLGGPSPVNGAEPESQPPCVRDQHPDDPDSFKGERPRGRRGFGRRHRHQTYDTLSEDVRLGLQDFIEQHFPELYQELSDLELDAPEAFARKMNRLLPQMLKLMQLEQEDPQVFPHRVKELRISTQIRALARRLWRLPAADRDPDQVERLQRLLARRFDARQKIHRLEVKQLERRLAEAKERLDQAEKDKEEIVAQELEDTLTGSRPPRGSRGPQGPRGRKGPSPKPVPPPEQEP